jgi:hypothetical protein
MKEILLVLAFAALTGAAVVVSCGEEDEAIHDAGGATSEQTEAYFGLVAGAKKYTGTQGTGEDETVADYEVSIAADTTSFTNRRTIARKWKAGGFEMLTEWFEAKGPELFYIRYRYMDAQSQERDIHFETPILYGKNPWSEADPPLSTTVGSETFEYSLLKESIDVPAGTFEDVFKVVTREGSRKAGSYHWVPNEGIVAFKINEHPALGTLLVLGLTK